MMKRILVAGLLYGIIPSVLAETRTVTLSVPQMDCITCPITVRKALERVDGVNQAVVDFKRKTATVTFDTEKVDAAQLTQATTNAGYPSDVVKADKP